jgi:hypothetical protein
MATPHRMAIGHHASDTASGLTRGQVRGTLTNEMEIALAQNQQKSQRAMARTVVSWTSLALFLMLSLAVTLNLHADTVYLTNGWKYADVTITEETDTNIVIELSSGETITLPKNAVAGTVVATKGGEKLDRGSRSVKLRSVTGQADGSVSSSARRGRRTVSGFRTPEGIPIFTNLPWKFDREYEQILTQLEPINLYRPSQQVSAILKQALTQEVGVSDERRTYSVILSEELNDTIKHYAHYYDIRPELVMAVIKSESNFVTNAVSKKGAMGLMQLMPRTAEAMNITDPFDPQQNIAGGTQYLAKLLRTFDGNERLAVAAYNAGPGRVKQYGGIPPFPETRDYVARVFRHVDLYARRFGS